MIKFSKQLSLGASGVVLNFLNTSNWQSQTNTKTKTKSDHLENPGKPAAQSLGLYFMTFLQEGADKRALVIIDVSCVTNLQSHYFRHRWCRHQAADWGSYGRSCRQLWFISPPCHQSVKDLRVHFWFNEVLSLPRDSIWHGAYFQYLAPNLVQNCQKKIPPMYLTLCHMQPQMSGVVRIKQILIPICWYVHLVKELYYMFTTGSTIFFNSFQVHDTLFMYGWLMIESSSAEDLLHIWWWSTAAAFVRTILYLIVYKRCSESVGCVVVEGGRRVMIFAAADAAIREFWKLLL